MYKKTILLLFFLFTISLCNNIVFAKAQAKTNVFSNLNDKEKLFIKLHLISKKEKQFLDSIFTNLNPDLIKLLDGKNIKKTPVEIKKLFEQEGFSVYTFRAKQLYQTGNDGFPARIILQHKDFSEYFLKIGFDNYVPRKNIGRIILADLINSIIDEKEYNITTLGKIEKKIYLRPGRANNLVDHNYIVLSPTIKGTAAHKGPDGFLSFDTFTKKYYEDFMFITNMLQLEDITPENIIVDENFKIIIIDTEILNHQLHDKLLQQMFGSKSEKTQNKIILNSLEKKFIKYHQVSEKEKKQLDALFSNLNKTIVDILDGKETSVDKNELHDALICDCFTIHTEDMGEELVLEHPMVANYVIKIGLNASSPLSTISRIITSDRINNIIKNFNINTVVKTNKKLYKRPNRPDNLSDLNYIVLSSKINGIPYDQAPLLNKKDTLDINNGAYIVANFLQSHDAKQLEMYLEPSNILFTKNKKIAFISTKVKNVKKLATITK